MGRNIEIGDKTCRQNQCPTQTIGAHTSRFVKLGRQQSNSESGDHPYHMTGYSPLRFQYRAASRAEDSGSDIQEKDPKSREGRVTVWATGDVVNSRFLS